MHREIGKAIVGTNSDAKSFKRMKDNRGSNAPLFPREPIKGPELDHQSCGYNLLRMNIRTGLEWL
jgi:hypothetical protein